MGFFLVRSLLLFVLARIEQWLVVFPSRLRTSICDASRAISASHHIAPKSLRPWRSNVFTSVGRRLHRSLPSLSVISHPWARSSPAPLPPLASAKTRTYLRPILFLEIRYAAPGAALRFLLLAMSLVRNVYIVAGLDWTSCLRVICTSFCLVHLTTMATTIRSRRPTRSWGRLGLSPPPPPF